MKNNKGYTLVELIITLAIVGIMIVPIFNTFLETTKVNLISKREISGAYVAQNVMEALKGAPSDALDALVTSGPVSSISSSARTDFNVTVTVTNVTASLGVALETPVVTQEVIPDADVTLTLPSQGNTGFISFKDASPNIPVISTDTNIVIRVGDGISSFIELVDVNTTEHFDPAIASDVYFNIVGPNSGTPLNWTIELVNHSATSNLHVKRIDDKLNLIDVSVSSSELSTSDIYISNSMPLVTGEVPAAKSWYNVVVEVEYGAIVYEVLESTIGK